MTNKGCYNSRIVVSGLARHLIAVAVLPGKVSAYKMTSQSKAVNNNARNSTNFPEKVSALKWLHNQNLSIIIQKIRLIF